ncbi:MAG TPA: hypothetical protein VG147_06720 [Solirubrobacteraceae bacterium]|nr:hypothetical protein [Solirubrobacteraceae bacterium]
MSCGSPPLAESLAAVAGHGGPAPTGVGDALTRADDPQIPTRGPDA